MDEDTELREAIRLSLLAASVEPSFAPTANVNRFRLLLRVVLMVARSQEWDQLLAIAWGGTLEGSDAMQR